MDIRTLLLNSRGESAPALVAKYGRAAVVGEIDEMMHHDLADVAALAAEAIGETGLARTARQIVANSGSY